MDVITQTYLTSAEMGGLSPLQIHHPPGTFAITPASRIALQAIGEKQHLLAGNGLDWGSGTGCLTLAAALIDQVDRVIGLELSEPNVAIARHNAQRNQLSDKVRFYQSDSYVPSAENERLTLEQLKGKINFVLSNPPSSEEDDGFEFRRIVLRGARDFLVPHGVVLLNISYQYGHERIMALSDQIAGYRYDGVIATTDWVPFDLGRPDLYQCLVNYAAEEAQGGMQYEFSDPSRPKTILNAQVALAAYEQTQRNPLSKWQTHLFTFLG